MIEALLIRAAAVALIAYVVTRKDCPFSVCLKLRNQFPSFKPLHCSLCAAFWLACLFSFVPAIYLQPLAVAGVAVFLISFFVLL